jgi:hypothetical protein
MRIAPDLWQSRLSQFSYRDLFYLHGLCLLPQSIGYEEYRPASVKRKLLQSTIWEYIKAKNLALDGREVPLFNPAYMEACWYKFGWFWDNMQFALKAKVCGGYENRAYVDPDLWEESDDDEPVA